MTTASKITMVRVAMIPMYMAAMYLSHGQAGMWMYISLGIFIIASLTDFVDGYIARHYNQTTDFGKFLDPLADKLLTIAAVGADDRSDPGICRHRSAAGGSPEGKCDRRRLERKGKDCQHHGGALRYDGSARGSCA